MFWASEQPHPNHNKNKIFEGGGTTAIENLIFFLIVSKYLTRWEQKNWTCMKNIDLGCRKLEQFLPHVKIPTWPWEIFLIFLHFLFPYIKGVWKKKPKKKFIHVLKWSTFYNHRSYLMGWHPSNIFLKNKIIQTDSKYRWRVNQDSLKIMFTYQIWTSLNPRFSLDQLSV